MSARVWITGCTGTIGRCLIPALRRHLPDAHLAGSALRLEGARTLGLDDAVAVDVRDAAAVRAAMERVRPDRIVHLASRRAGELAELLAVQVLGTRHVLQAALERSRGTRVLVVGSAAEIGYAETAEMPLAESCACRPVDAYGVTKLAQSTLAYAHAHAERQHVIRARLFNLLGPGVPDTLLPGRCAALIRQAPRGAREPLRFRSLDMQRDYLDVRDACEALVLALERGRPGALYHVGSGLAIRGRTIVEHLLAAARSEKGALRYEESADGALTVPLQIADARLAMRELGWQPRIPLEQSLDDLWKESAETRTASTPGGA
jgi:GDP-4-dehydro-6-deoxy-D-mannose reductase